MYRKTTTQILTLTAFLVLLISGANLAAQFTPLGVPNQHPNGAQNHPGKGNAACQRIVSECERLGFVQGEWRKDNGLWRDCVDPVVKGGTPTRDGKPIQVPVSSSDIQSCRAAQARHR